MKGHYFDNMEDVKRKTRMNLANIQTKNLKNVSNNGNKDWTSILNY